MDDPSTERLNGKYASMQFAHKARAKRLAEEGRWVKDDDATQTLSQILVRSILDVFFFLRLLPEDATVDEDGVQLGGKRAAIQYAHR